MAIKFCSLLLIAIFAANVDCEESRISVKDRWLVDTAGRVRIFRGFNNVKKEFPWYDEQILNETRLNLYKEWGFNCVRLGAMWKGLEPVRNQYNDTYLSIISDAVKLLKSRGLYTLLDAHQDGFSAAESVCPNSVCYNGIPDWVSDNFQSPYFKFPWPFSNIDSKNWPLIYFTKSVSYAFQQFYNNKDNTLEQFAKFWKKIAEKFKDEPSILGYELLNEPWAGDIFQSPTRLLPGIAGRENLLPFYDRLFAEISSVDDHTNIFYEPVTWAIYSNLRDLGTGFDRIPGGPAFINRAVLSYHYYCFPMYAMDKSKNYPFYLRILCDKFFGSRMFPKMLSDVSITGGSLFLTEFGLCAPDNSTSSINTIECNFVLTKADEYLQSWMYWDAEFFDNTGAVNSKLLQSFARPYARATAGIPRSMNFDLPLKTFTFSFINDPSIILPTEIFVPKIHYPSSLDVTIAPLDVTFHHDEAASVLLIDHNHHDQLITISFKPKP